MKKFIALFVLIAIGSFSFADNLASSRSYRGIGDVFAIGDPSSKQTVEVDGDGILAVNSGSGTSLMFGGNGTPETFNAQFKLSNNITIYGVLATVVTADDNIAFYDATSADGNPKFDVRVGSATDTKVVELPTGISFDTDIFISGTDSDHGLTIFYSVDS